jgi:hypothetical protein
VKDLAGLIVGIVVVARLATGCETTCDPEVETTAGGLKVKVIDLHHRGDVRRTNDKART